MTNYLDVARRYAVFNESELQVIYANSEQVDVISEAHSQLRRALRIDPDSGYEEIVKNLSYVRYRLIASVLPFDDENLGLAELSNFLKAQLVSLNQNTSDYRYVRAAIESLDELIEIKVNPIGLVVRKILESFQGSSVIALGYGHQKLRTSEYFESLDLNVEIVQSSQLKRIEVIDKLILVGPPKFFDT